ncbi:MAG TPA: PD-(D/E)XK nuclease family protein [Candidatus Baltobacteraceae bacterium]|nr:PD-(D/E)XK nuclease family protein [Candidatus Baltobacteraceae bacterium]
MVETSPPLVASIVAALRWSRTHDERDALRVLDSPLSGLDKLDGGALLAQRERRPLLDALAQAADPLPHEAKLAARRLAQTLASLMNSASDTPLSVALTMLRTTLELDQRLDDDDLAMLDLVATTVNQTDDLDAVIAGASRILIIPRNQEPPRMLTAHAPQTPERVEAFSGKFSASALAAYIECARKWYYRYRCKVVEDPGSSASFYGSAFHLALERFHTEIPRISEHSVDALKRKLDDTLGDAFASFRTSFQTPIEFESQLRRARRTAPQYLAWMRERALKRPFTVVGIERVVDLELDGQRFIGFIDRLDRDDASGNLTVVDYKTGSIAQSAAEYRRGIAEGREFQLPFYYWAVASTGERVERLALIPLKDPALDVKPIELEIVPVATPPSRSAHNSGTISIDELHRARARMVELARHLTSEPITEFPPTSDPEACAYCAYRDACRERPAKTDVRFGR